MPVNIEIKAKSDDWDAQWRKAQAMAGSREDLLQEDVFFKCPEGRLKLRTLGNGESVLIFYRRPDTAGPKLSEYSIVPVPDPGSMTEILSSALGQAFRVRKRRTVFHVGQTRVHFDEVEGLGRFIELEVVLKPGQTREEGRAIADELMAKLGIRPKDLLDKAYADLLNDKIGCSINKSSDPWIRYVITLTRTDKPMTEAAVRRHVAHLKSLDKRGKLVLCGPFQDHKGGMVIVRADSLEEAKSIAESDPFVKEGLETYSLRAWELSCEENNHMGMG